MPDTNSNFYFLLWNKLAFTSPHSKATAGISGKAWEAFVLHISKSSPWKPSINLKQLQSVRTKKVKFYCLWNWFFKIRSRTSQAGFAGLAGAQEASESWRGGCGWGPQQVKMVASTPARAWPSAAPMIFSNYQWQILNRLCYGCWIVVHSAHHKRSHRVI